MSKTHPPELKKYMDKQISFKLNGNRYSLSYSIAYYSHVNLETFLVYFVALIHL
jgi:mRNA-degrading endonuclease HigB of HigAB toxin-antitoxin module